MFVSLSVPPPARMEQLGSQLMELMKFGIWVFLENTSWFKYDRDCLCVNLATSVPVIFEPPCMSKKSMFHQNPTRITDTLHEDQTTYLIISRSILIRKWNISDKCLEKIKTHILYTITFFFFWKSCRLWDNLEKYCRRGQVTDDNMAACTLHARYLRLKTHTKSL